MKPALRQISLLLLTTVTVLVGGCTYSGNLEESFYTPATHDHMDGGKIPLSIAVVNTAALKNASFKAEAGGHGVDIPVGEPIVNALRSELSGIFTKSAIVDEAKSSDYDLYVHPEIKWIETHRTASAVLTYAVIFQATIRSEKEDFTVSKYTTEKKVVYSPPGVAVGAQTLMFTSLFLLAPLTVPVTTQSVGDRAKELISRTISELVREFGESLAQKGPVREYATLSGSSAHPRTPPAASVSTDAARSPYKRAKSKYDEFLNGVVIIRTAAGIGSGFFVSSDGLIVTNRHVVENENTVAVRTRDGGVGLAQVIGRSTIKDLALIRMAGSHFTYLRLSNGEQAGVGNDVIAIGTPEGLDWSVSRGIISAVRSDRHIHLIQTDAAINPGNSGGPLIDLTSGMVVGVNTLGFRKDIAEGLNFAVSSEDVLMTFPDYLKRTP
jgi:S1-C subfamily serine protease